MKNFKTVELGAIAEIGVNYENGKAFLHDELELTGCEISVSILPAGAKIPFNHRHKQNEEIYIFLKGCGSLILDGETVEVKEGSCIKVLPAAVRSMAAQTTLNYICIQAKENSLVQFGFGDAELC